MTNSGSLFEVYQRFDFSIVHGDGTVVRDSRGTDYLDFYGGHAVISIGHNHPHWVQRLQTQMSSLSFYSNAVDLPIQEEFGHHLCTLSAKPNHRLFLCNSGAEANENAIKLASFHTKRQGILAFTGGFHGRTSLALAATDNPTIKAPINHSTPVHHLPLNDLEQLETYFKTHGNTLACAIIEGIQGVGGVYEPTDEFLTILRSLTQEYGVVLIADSVQCGYTRSGEFFAHDKSSVIADIYTMAKGMGNGFPVAGLLISEDIKPVKGQLGTTFGGNPLACAAGLAVLEVLEDENVAENVKQRGQQLWDGLTNVSFVKNLRGRGLMIGFDTPEEAPTIRERLLKEHQVLTGSSSPTILRLLPPLTVTAKECDQFLEACYHLDQHL